MLSEDASIISGMLVGLNSMDYNVMMKGEDFDKAVRREGVRREGEEGGYEGGCEEEGGCVVRRGYKEEGGLCCEEGGCEGGEGVRRREGCVVRREGVRRREVVL